MLNSPAYCEFLKRHSAQVMPTLFAAMYRGVHGRAHWSRGVLTALMNSLKVLSEIDPVVFEDCSLRFKVYYCLFDS